MNVARHGGWMIVLLLLPTTCLAAPWSYEQPIGDGYSIAVSTTVSCLCAGRGNGVLAPGNYRPAARIDGYSTTRHHVFIRAYTMLFIVAKADNSVIGPLSESEFAQHPVVLASGKVKWKEPHQPYGDTLFWLIVFLANPAFLLGMALILLFVVAMLSMIVRRLRHARPEALD